jgi:hypothetical protein
MESGKTPRSAVFTNVRRSVPEPVDDYGRRLRTTRRGFSQSSTVLVARNRQPGGTRQDECSWPLRRSGLREQRSHARKKVCRRIGLHLVSRSGSLPPVRVSRAVRRGVATGRAVAATIGGSMKALKRSTFILILALSSALVLCMAGCTSDDDGDGEEHHGGEEGNHQPAPAAKCDETHVVRVPFNHYNCGTCTQADGHSGNHKCGECGDSFQ